MESILVGFGTFFLILVAILLLLILGIVIFFVVLFRSIPAVAAIDQQVQTHVENAIRGLTTHWNPQELRHWATPRLLDSLDFTQAQHDLFQCEQALGALTLYPGSKGSLQGLPVMKGFAPIVKFMSKKSQKRDLEVAQDLMMGEYTAEVTFERGIARFELQMLNQGQDWLVNALSIAIAPPGSAEGQFPRVYTFGEKVSMEILIQEKKQKMELEKLM